MMIKKSLFVVLLAALVVPQGMALGQDPPHPEKVVYAKAASWPATAPGEVELKHFRPFRAVYDRSYTQGSGPEAGQKRQDRVIVHAEEVGWEGRRAAAITMIDTGAAKSADTNMRTLTMVMDLENLQVLFEIGPLPGAAKDYYIGLFSGDEAILNIIKTESQEHTPQKMPAKQPGFGAGSWVMASMDLKPGMLINLAPYYSMQANSLSRSNYGRVIERTTVENGSGGSHEAWVVETSGWYGLDKPKVLRLYLQDAPPYYLGTEIFNYDTGEGKRFVWLRDFQTMEH